jgi:hypothetical protein
MQTLPPKDSWLRMIQVDHILAGNQLQVVTKEVMKIACEDNRKVPLVWRMFADQSHPILEFCAALGIYRTTLCRYVKEAKSPE